MEKKGETYNVEFDIGKKDHEVWIDSKGLIIRHKEELNTKDLPANIAHTIKQTYLGSKIVDVEKITESTQIYYKVELKGYRMQRTIVMDQTGNQVDKDS